MLRNHALSTVLLALATMIVAISAGVAYGAPGTGRGHGNADPSCSANPDPVARGQAFTLSAVGLPTVDSVWLIAQSPTGSSTVSLIFVNPDGSWSNSEASDQSGQWTYTFSGVLANKKYGAVATCTEQVN
jgi:hypothetical protein